MLFQGKRSRIYKTLESAGDPLRQGRIGLKINVVVIFGGCSSEHEISCMSAATIVKALDPERYTVRKVFITKEGLWRYYEGDIEHIDARAVSEQAPEAAILPGQKKAQLMVLRQDAWTALPMDIVIPVLHGKNGEDGTIQGLLEIARVPYVGCGVLASAASMDKLTTKRLVMPTGIRQARYVAVFAREFESMEAVLDRVEAALSYPVYVKPANAGSSVGVSKAEDRAALEQALHLAAEQDSRILVEETIVGREVECSVLGGETPKVSSVGEILAADTFYTYDAKYHNAESKTVIDPNLPAETVEEIRRAALTVFQAVNGYGLARVDFFVEAETGEVVFNEINTFPGFTSISMYPMLWKRQGYAVSDLVDELIEWGLRR